MRTSWERRLREDLHELADVPAPDGSADRALAGARKARRRRVVLTGVTSLALVVLVAVPMLGGMPVGTLRLPFGGAGGGAPCETATDEADPPNGVAVPDQPRFVRVFLSKLPPRDDFFLQSAHGVCALSDVTRPTGSAVINLGPNREHGHLTFTVYYENGTRTCAGMARRMYQTVFCEEGTAITPLVLGQTDGSDFVVTVVYPDARTVAIESLGTPLDVAVLRSVATDPELAELLP